MSIFNRKKDKVESDSLPASLEAALKGLSVYHRSPVDDCERILLHFAGENVSSWYHSPETTRNRIQAAYPGLSENQLLMALRAINGLIRAANREQEPATKRSNWAKNEYVPRGMFEPR